MRNSVIGIGYKRRPPGWRVRPTLNKPLSKQGKLQLRQRLRVAPLVREPIHATLARNSCKVATMSLAPKAPTKTPANLPSSAVWRA